MIFPKQLDKFKAGVKFKRDREIYYCLSKPFRVKDSWIVKAMLYKDLEKPDDYYIHVCIYDPYDSNYNKLIKIL